MHSLRADVASVGSAAKGAAGSTAELHGLVISLQDEVMRLSTGLRIAQAGVTEATNASQGLFVALRDELEGLRAEVAELRGCGAGGARDGLGAGGAVGNDPSLDTAVLSRPYPPSDSIAGASKDAEAGSRGIVAPPLSALQEHQHPAGVAHHLDRCTLPKSIYGDVVLTLCTPDGEKKGCARCVGRLAGGCRLLVMLLVLALNVAMQAGITYAIGKHHADTQEGWRSKLASCDRFAETCSDGEQGCCPLQQVCGETAWTFECGHGLSLPGLSGLELWEPTSCALEKRYAAYNLHRDMSDWSWLVVLAAVLVAWHCRALRELLGALHLARLVLALPRPKEGSCHVLWSQGAPELVAVPRRVKCLALLFLVPVKLALLVLVYWVGAQLLISMTTVRELVVNVVLLEFVWQIDDLLFHSIVPGTRRRLLLAARPLQLRPCCPSLSRSATFNLVLLALVTAGPAAVLWWQYRPMYQILSDTVLKSCKVA